MITQFQQSKIKKNQINKDEVHIQSVGYDYYLSFRM